MDATRYLDPSTRDSILSMLKRQPCTIRQIADQCSSDSYVIVKYLSDLSRQGMLLVSYINGQVIVSCSPTVHH